MTTVQILLPDSDYDPTESGVIWQTLAESGFDVRFGTPDGEVAPADRRLTETGFGPLSRLLMTDSSALETYDAMTASGAFRDPLSYEAVSIDDCDALYVPGGHAEGMKTLHESEVAQDLVLEAFDRALPVGAVCHGVLLLARSVDPETGRSVIHDRETTALPRFMELGAWGATWVWLRDYYRTYDVSVEAEVKGVLASPKQFHRGPILPRRDSPGDHRGFTVRDGTYISARWPGDCYTFADEFASLIDEDGTSV